MAPAPSTPAVARRRKILRSPHVAAAGASEDVQAKEAFMWRPREKIFGGTVKNRFAALSSDANHYWARHLAFSQRTSFLSERAISRTSVMV